MGTGALFPSLRFTSPSLPLKSVEVAADGQCWWVWGFMKWTCSGLAKDQQALFKSSPRWPAPLPTLSFAN